MDWITEAIAIGTRIEAEDVGVLRAGRFRSVLSLDGALSEVNAEALELAEMAAVPLRDGSGNDLRTFLFAVETLSRLVQAHAPVLVHCQYGRSRSPVVVAAYLMRTQGLDHFQARAMVAAKRDISISSALIPFLFQVSGT